MPQQCVQKSEFLAVFNHFSYNTSSFFDSSFHHHHPLLATCANAA